MKKHFRLAVAAVGALATVGLTAGIAYASGAISSTTTDATIMTTANTNLSPVGGLNTVIESLTLPAGKWIVHADNTMVNFGPSDYTRCGLFRGTTALPGGHASMVGDPNAFGAQGPGVYVATVSETNGIVLSVPTKVSLGCGHDTSNGSTPYIDAGATMWAHRATSLVQLTTP
jgi:hypothetical protein